MCYVSLISLKGSASGVHNNVMSEDEQVLPFDAEPQDDPEEAVALPDHPYEKPDIREIPLTDIQPLENVRSATDPPEALTENIRVHGLLHAIVVRPAADKSHRKPFELIVGYRRLQAFQKLGWSTIPASVHPANDQEVLAELISENLQRENPSPIDEARVMQRMIETFNWSHAQVAAQLGVDRSQVTKRLGLLKLPDKVQTMVSEGQLTASHAEVVARLDSSEQQQELADLAVRLDTPVSKLNNYASKIKAEQHEEEMAEVQPPDQDTPLEGDSPELVAVELPNLETAELKGKQRNQALLYVLLRSANDVEMLQWLESSCGADYGQLWEWVLMLSADQVDEMTTVMTRRWLGAAHRFPTLPNALVTSLSGGSVPAVQSAPAEPLEAEEWDEDEEWDEEDE